MARSIDADDLVVVTLGNSQNPMKRMLGETRTTPRDICEVGTRNVIAAMTASGAKRLVVVSAFGIGDTKAKASWLVKLFYAVLLREQMADKERQEPLVRASGLDWTLVQPVALTDGPPTGRWLASSTGNTGVQKITRDDLADFILAELLRPAHIGATVTLSGVKSNLSRRRAKMRPHRREADVTKVAKIPHHPTHLPPDHQSARTPRRAWHVR